MTADIVKRAERAAYMRDYRARKRAEGYRIVRGLLVFGPAPPKHRAPEHGATAYHRGCRCEVCRAANADNQRRYRARGRR